MGTRQISKTKIVLAELLAGNEVTSLDMFRKYLITRLSSIIFNLHRKGFIISATLVGNKYGGHYAKYSILTKTAMQYNKRLAKEVGYAG